MRKDQPVLLRAELKACLRTLSHAADTGMGRVVMETDAVPLKHALSSIEFELPRMGLLFTEAKYLLLPAAQPSAITEPASASGMRLELLAKTGACMEPASSTKPARFVLKKPIKAEKNHGLPAVQAGKNGTPNDLRMA